MGKLNIFCIKSLGTAIPNKWLKVCTITIRPYFFLILGLRIFFQNIKVGGGKKIKIKITKKNFFYLI